MKRVTVSAKPLKNCFQKWVVILFHKHVLMLVSALVSK